jgi:hypothetical protein
LTAAAPPVDASTKQDIDALRASIAGLSSKVAADGADIKQAAEARSQTVANATAAFDGKVAALQTSIDSLKAQSQKADAGAADLKAVQDRTAALETSVPELQKQIADLRTRASSAQAGVDDLRAGQKNLEGKITNAPALAVLADSLVKRISGGQPFAAEVTALESLGIDPAKIAALRPFAGQGVASIKTLASQFDDITDGLISAAHKLPANASYWVRLKEEAGSLVSIRKPGEAGGGDDVASRISEIKTDLARGDVVGANKAWTLLPADAKAKPEAAAWGALVAAHAEASAAAHAIETEAIASLGAKKS